MAGVPGGDMERTLYTGEYADFRISCNGAIFPVHKMVLGSASDFFRVMFESDFKVGLQTHRKRLRLVFL